MTMAYQRRPRELFSTVKSEGAILPMDLLQRVSDPQNAQLAGLTPDDYNLPALQLHEAISRAWTDLLGLWRRFQREKSKLPMYNNGTELTRKRWLLPLLGVLGYTAINSQPAILVGERSYAVSQTWGHTPIHLVSCKIGLDQSTASARGERRASPHSLLQELLNSSPEYLWGIVSNGLSLRILRNSKSLTRQAYVEFDLEEMFEHEVYADFILFWLLCHQSRVEGKRPAECWLEKWSQEAHASGTRALEDLRRNVAMAISELGSGYLSHPANGRLRARLQEKQLSAMGYYTQLLHMIYRWLILFVAEDREILFHPDALPAARQLYTEYYSTARLRALADCTLGTRHSDLYYSLKLIMEKLSQEHGCPELGLPALNGFIFSPEAVSDLNDCQLANYALLAAIRHLGYIESGRVRRIIDYKNLGSEELGSVYESLLELHPVFHLETGTFGLRTAAGNQRKTTGSYYTPASLVFCLLDTALDPVLNEAASKPTAAEAEAAILNLNVCDPACGSGHFLIAAAHRMAKKLAAVRTGDEEPPPADRRQALRDVVGHCIYGVDINPMAVELCKVNLWLESIDPGKPLSFLDAHIQCGNSLLGTTPALLKQGIPDAAFEPIDGDDRKLCSVLKKLNKKYREGNQTLRDGEERVFRYQTILRERIAHLDSINNTDVQGIYRQQQAYDEHLQTIEYTHSKLWADAWCAAFVWRKCPDALYPFTHDDFRSLEQGIGYIDAYQHNEIKRLAMQYQFFHWHLAFPQVFHVPGEGEEAENEQAGWSGGFDVMLGNPPWEKIKIQEKEWFASRRPDIASAANAAQRRKMIEQLQKEDIGVYAAFHEDLRQADGESSLIRHSGRYPLCGRGDVNTYAIFAESMRLLLQSKGRVGCIVPSGIATDDTTKYFFQNLMESRSLSSLYDFENRQGIFSGVHRSYKFCLLTLTGLSQPATRGAAFTFFAQRVEDLQENHRCFTLDADTLRLLNPNTHTCPVFRSKHDLKLVTSLYQRFPVLVNDGPPKHNPWNTSFHIMFNMATDSHLFRGREQLEADGWQLRGNVFHKKGEKYWPLYEGKLVGHFDSRFSTYEEAQQTFVDVPLAYHVDPDKLSMPRYWVHETSLPGFMKEGRTALLAFRRIARSTDIRTAIFSIIPAVPCSDSLFLALMDTESRREIAFMAASTSSFVFDYIVRQKIGGVNVNFFILKQLPVLPPQHYETACSWDRTCTTGGWIYPRTLELTYTAWDGAAFAKDCGYSGPPFRWDKERRFLLRCELDAAYFHLYGIAHDDVDYIMETFPIVAREDEKQYGEYRTKRVILEVYDEMLVAMETGRAYETRLVPGPANPAVAHKEK